MMANSTHSDGAAAVDGLKGKAVLITGAGSGIGAAVAKGFARSGAKVAVHYRTNRKGAEEVAKAIGDLGGQAILVTGDMRSVDQTRDAVKQTVDAFGRLDILINNAGAMVKRVAPADVTDEVFDEIIDVNCRSVVMMSCAAIPVFKAQKSGNIINVSSVAARFGGAGGAGLYASSKGFVLTYTRNLARELAADGIRVNQVVPGLISTPFHEGITSPEQMKQLESMIPMRRVGQAEDCVGAFLFLAADPLSGYVTGQSIDVNGGQFMV
jgi:3-oxoacyl-[acyl-carrier protein] reductase